MPRNFRFTLATLAAFGALTLALRFAYGLTPSTPPVEAAGADTIYFGGPIMHRRRRQPAAEAVAVEGQLIVAVGTRDGSAAQRGPATGWSIWRGETLVPGFLDPHSHYINSLTVANQVNVFAPPAGPGADVARIVEALQVFANELVRRGRWSAYGYDDTLMPGGRTLHKEDLDADFPDNPVLVGPRLDARRGAQLRGDAEVRHHRGDRDTARRDDRAQGGLHRARRAGDGDRVPADLRRACPNPRPQQEIAWSRAGQMLYAAAGITTAHEGATHAADVELIYRAAEGGANLIDVVAYPFILELDEVLAANPPQEFGSYRNRVKLGGVKVTLDGSPQGRTAYFTTPYLVDGPGRPDTTGVASSASPRTSSTAGSSRSTTSGCRWTSTPTATPPSTSRWPPTSSPRPTTWARDRLP